MNPKISVLMSTLNRSKDVNRSIKSILNQTYSNFEFIICDDGSTDDTLKYLKLWSKKDSRIKILINQQNKGLQISLNRCLRASNGKYIARMDDDDIALPNRFKVQLNYMEHNPEVSFIGSNVLLFDKKDGIYGQTHFIKDPTKYQLFKSDEFCHPSIFARASVFKRVGGYSENYHYLRIEDHELWLRLYSLGYRGVNIERPLLKYYFNIHEHKSKFHDYYNRFRLLKMYRVKLGIGLKGYIYVVIPLIKLLVPSFIRNMVYSYKYNDK